MDGYLDTQWSLNPADGSFSVHVWVKGGAPGQAIMSQEGGADWLLIDSQGNIMTTLVGQSGRQNGVPLRCETVVTDGDWHRIGFVWDGAYRSLYVDGDIAAIDVLAQANFPDSPGRLFIGAASDRSSETFWSGLVDDVRIYNRALER